MIKLAVCDDEPLAIRELAVKIKTLMEQLNTPCQITPFLNGETLLTKLREEQQPFHAIFLDIKMDAVSGLDAAREIRKTDGETLLIFVTALGEYVFDAFDVSPTNFLLKPIADEKLLGTLKRIIAAAAPEKKRDLLLTKGGEVVKIPLSHIVYCEVLGHRVFLYGEGFVHPYSHTIDSLEEELTGDFFRCHRSYLLHLGHVKGYRDGMATVVTGERIPVATRRQGDFLKALLHHQKEALGR